MQASKLSDMVRGWFVGDFEPSLCKTNDVEVAVKEYAAGDYEGRHYHMVATEYTVVVSGTVEMNGVRYEKGDIVIVTPCESMDFKAVTSSVNVVVKIPGASNDKYLGEYCKNKM